VNELFWGKCDSRLQENPLFLVRCSMFDFQFLAPPEDLDLKQLASLDLDLHEKLLPYVESDISLYGPRP
jgi:hypothetical protein